MNDGRALYPCFGCGGARVAAHTEFPNLDTMTASMLPRVAASLCEDCGLVQQNPCVTQEKMNEIYATFEDKVTVENLEHSATELEGRSRLAALQKLVPAPATLLEIGCSDGTFLTLARDAGYDVCGVDPSEANIAKAKARKPPLNVAAGFADKAPAGRKFDVVCHFYVLEHTFDPVAFLKDLRSRLKDGGTMFFEVPDVARFASLPFANFLFPYQHTIHLSPATAAGLLARAGLEMIPLGDSPGSKSYGTRFAARAVAKAAAPKPDTAASRKQLDAYFGRRGAILDGMRASVKKWAAQAKGRPGPCVIFGAGENGRVLLGETELEKLFTDIRFTDNNSALHGRIVDGLPVVAPKELGALKPALVIAASIDYQDDMARQAASLGVPPDRIVKLYA